MFFIVLDSLFIKFHAAHLTELSFLSLSSHTAKYFIRNGQKSPSIKPLVRISMMAATIFVTVFVWFFLSILSSRLAVHSQDTNSLSLMVGLVNLFNITPKSSQVSELSYWNFNHKIYTKITSIGLRKHSLASDYRISYFHTNIKAFF